MPIIPGSFMAISDTLGHLDFDHLSIAGRFDFHGHFLGLDVVERLALFERLARLPVPLHDRGLFHGHADAVEFQSYLHCKSLQDFR